MFTLQEYLKIEKRQLCNGIFTLTLFPVDGRWISAEISNKSKMYKLLVINFLLKLYALKNIFKHILEKYGQRALTLARKVERNRTKISKITCDLTFLLTCKRNNLIPIFANPKLSIQVNHRVKLRIAKTIIDTELRNKHKKRNCIKTEMKNDVMELKSLVGYVSLCAINAEINKCIRGKQKEWKRIHDGKQDKLFVNNIDMIKVKSKRSFDAIHNF